MFRPSTRPGTRPRSIALRVRIRFVILCLDPCQAFSKVLALEGAPAPSSSQPCSSMTSSVLVTSTPLASGTRSASHTSRSTRPLMRRRTHTMLVWTRDVGSRGQDTPRPTCWTPQCSPRSCARIESTVAVSTTGTQVRIRHMRQAKLWTSPAPSAITSNPGKLPPSSLPTSSTQHSSSTSSALHIAGPTRMSHTPCVAATPHGSGPLAGSGSDCLVRSGTNPSGDARQTSLRMRCSSLQRARIFWTSICVHRSVLLRVCAGPHRALFPPRRRPHAHALQPLMASLRRNPVVCASPTTRPMGSVAPTLRSHTNTSTRPPRSAPCAIYARGRLRMQCLAGAPTTFSRTAPSGSSLSSPRTPTATQCSCWGLPVPGPLEGEPTSPHPPDARCSPVWILAVTIARARAYRARGSRASCTTSSSTSSWTRRLASRSPRCAL